MLAQEEEQQWDQEKGEEAPQSLVVKALGSAARMWETARDQVLVHWSPLGLESALQSARGLALG